MEHVLTLDVGTTSVKAALWDRELNLVSLSLREYGLLYPKPNWVEVNPEAYWDAATDGTKEVLAKSGVSPGDVCSVACTTQGETLIPVGADGEPIGNAIVWLDERAGDEAARLERTFGTELFFSKTGLPELTGACPAAKALWLRKRPEYAGMRKLLLPEDYLIHKMTGAPVSNPALVTSAGWLDIRADKLWDGMLSEILLPPSYLPEMREPGTAAGTLTREAAAALGLREGTPVAVGAMDQVASALGAGNGDPGIVFETSGTALVASCVTDRFDGVLRAPATFYRFTEPGKFLLLSFEPSAGLWLKWFRDAFCPELAGRADAYAVMDSWAADASSAVRFDGSGLTRGLSGLTLSSTRGGCVRAILEALAESLKEHLERIETYGIRAGEVRSLGGGAKSRLWREIKSKICGVPVTVGPVTETASLGAAMLASGVLRTFLKKSSQ
ncbi:MAG: hypothetical protein LBR72_03985 [Oscillospiraceae bacterium]|nr:hypothetical protein [Oscillospiraceae bacterium]